MHHEIANRGDRQIETERLPVFAVIQREIHAALGGCEEETLAHGIFAHAVHGFVLRNPSDNHLPGFSPIVSAVGQWVQVVDAETIDGSVDGVGIEVGGVELCDLAPGGEFGRCDVLPRFADIARHMNKPVVSSSPDQVGIFRRRRK